MKSSEGYQVGASENLKTNSIISFVSELKGDLDGRDGPSQEMDVQSTLICDDLAPDAKRSLLAMSTISYDGSDEPSMAPVHETPSVARIITTLLSIPSNRKCADCRMHMVDSSQTFASFSPSLGKLPLTAPTRRSIEDFKFHHRAFAPVSQKRVKDDAFNAESDPALQVVQMLRGHGVFICKACAKTHTHLGPAIAIVKSANDFSTWSLEEARYIQQFGGNAASWSVYEGFIPDGWKRQMPSISSPVQQRVVFSIAKYNALAFVFPSSDSAVARRTWQALLERDKTLYRFAKPGSLLTDLSKITLMDLKDNSGTVNTTNQDSQMPDRFVDFFCVVGHKKMLHTGENRKDLYAIESPEGLALEPTVIDCYPERDAHSDMVFPDQIYRFVFPDGCHASETQKPPALFTFVLTAGNGYRLYGAALRVYDDTMETAQMKEVLHASGYTVPLPWWLSDSSAPPRSQDGTPARRPSDIVFLPKCLVVISHYPFFHAYREFLKQLYQLSILESPLPIERYITNFASELPLPPQGKVEVKFGFMSDALCTISRPAPNELPLASFSFMPLFTALSISNILVVAGCLLEETKVVLLSQRYGLLTPCAEAFLSFLFPFEWQGIYIPVMPYTLTDILDAPVPFLLGMHARYLANVKPESRPKGVVFVDLDRDTVHLGFSESNDDNGKILKRLPPVLPEKDSMKLRSKLQECGACQYVSPKNGIKGLITFGNGEYLDNDLREPYAYMEVCDSSLTSADARIRILDASEHAFHETGGSSIAAGFVSEEGQLSTKTSIDHSDKPDGKSRLFAKMRAKIERKQTPDYNDNSSRHSAVTTSTDFYNDPEKSGSFKSSEIRSAFLRFFTSIFNGYDKHASKTIHGELFRDEEFLNEKNLSSLKRNWLGNVLKTQMFQRFLEERLEDPHDASVLFFDEAIVAKNNRSMKKAIKHGKMTTPFLHDESWKISDSFTPPAPSNWGLPDDGRRYTYPRFPRLDKSRFGTARAKKRWPPEWEQNIQRKGPSRVKSLKRTAMLQNAIGSERIETLMTAFGVTRVDAVPTLLTKRSQLPAEMNLNWAVATTSQAIVHVLNEEMNTSSREFLTSPQKRSESENLANNVVTPDTALFAQEMLLAARRKQGILMLRIVKLQAHSKKYIHVSKFKRYASVLICNTTGTTIAEVSYVLKNAVIVQSFVRLYLAVKRYRRRLSSVLLIQRNYRRLRQLVVLKKVKQATIIQVWWRGIIARRLACNRRHSIILVQSVYRGITARFGYSLVKDEIRKIQAQIRAHLARKHAHSLLEQQVVRYRSQIFYLWTRASTPLSYRTQMWSLFKSSFLGSRIMVDELQRMWTFLVIPTSTQNDVSHDRVLAALEHMGCSIAFETKFLNVSSVISAAEQRQSRFHGEFSELGLQHAKRIETERLQVYERLNLLGKSSKLNDIYELFGMIPIEKKKKARVLGKLWYSLEFASASSKAMTLLFPELAEGIDIRQVKPSKKGLNRFHNKQKHTLLDPLDKDLWVDRKMDNLFRKNMSEVAIASMKTMPDLCVKLHTANVLKNASFQRQKHPRLPTHGEWRDFKREAIQNYLYT